MRVFTNGPGKRTKKLGCQLFFLLPGVNALLVLYGFVFFSKGRSSIVFCPFCVGFLEVDVGVNQGHNYPNMTLKRHKLPLHFLVGQMI